MSDETPTLAELAEWREVAEAATPGPWEVRNGNVEEYIPHAGEWGIVAYAHDRELPHIATFDPPTVLRLLDTLEAERGPAETELANRIRLISEAISRSYPTGLDAEAHTWRRLMKVAEEVGEVTEALFGYLGENPRKGHTHTIEDLSSELLDVALAALGAVSFLHSDDTDAVGLLTERTRFVWSRLSAVLDSTQQDSGDGPG